MRICALQLIYQGLWFECLNQSFLKPSTLCGSTCDRYFKREQLSSCITFDMQIQLANLARTYHCISYNREIQKVHKYF